MRLVIEGVDGVDGGVWRATDGEGGWGGCWWRR
jgi:hypothetical protein